MTDHWIYNTHQHKLSVSTNIPPSGSGLVFLVHGLAANQQQPLLLTCEQVFLEEGYGVIKRDARNTFGRSEGNCEDATITSYYEDLETVLERASAQSRYQEPFILLGHSMGAICAGLYAQNNPQKINNLILISTVVNRSLSQDLYSIEELNNWKKTGRNTEFPSKLPPLKRSFIEDRMRHDLLAKIDQLSMPTLLIVGDRDKRTPLSHHAILIAHLKCEKSLHVILNGWHSLSDPAHLQQVQNILKTQIDQWKNIILQQKS